MNVFGAYNQDMFIRPYSGSGISALLSLIFLLNLWFPQAGPLLRAGDDGRWAEVCSTRAIKRSVSGDDQKPAHTHCNYCLSQLSHQIIYMPQPTGLQHPFLQNSLAVLPAFQVYSARFSSVFDSRAPPPI